MADDSFELTESQMNALRDAFEAFDVNGDGEIPTKKIGEVVKNLGHNLRHNDIKELIECCDSDGEGTVNFEEFLPVLAQKLKEKQEEDFYKNMFRILDKEKRGFITCDKLRFILQGLAKDLELSEEDIDDMIQDIDEDGNNEVSFDEFYKLMTSE